MTSKFRLLWLTLLVFAANGAYATLKVVDEAWELDLGAVILPANEGAQLLGRRCDGCALEMLKTNSETRYFVKPGKTSVSLADLRKAAAQAVLRPAALVYVYYDPQTRVVRRLVLDMGP